MITIWCPIHNSHKVNDTDKLQCSFCIEALKQEKTNIRLTNAIATPGRCQFCGGPTPCLKES